MTEAPDFASLAPGRLFSLHGKRALVTGGSAGIGRAAALALGAAGAEVVITHVAQADGQAGIPNAAADVSATLGTSAHVIELDLSQPREIVLAAVDAGLGERNIDILVLNASIQIEQLLADITPEAMENQLRIDFENVVWLLQRFVPPMVTRGWGRVIAVSSVQEAQPRATMPVYAALKSALGNLMRNLAKTHARDGVTFNTVQPGLVVTPRNRWRTQDTGRWEALKASVNPMGRAAVEAELATAFVMLASPASSFTTGAELMVTGGGHVA